MFTTLFHQIERFLFTANLFWIAATVAFFLSFSGITFAGSRQVPAKIVIDNYSNNEIQRYPVALLRGHIVGDDDSTVVVENLSSSRPSRIARAEVREKRFAILVELVSGVNDLLVSIGSTSLKFRLEYRPSSNPFLIRLVYFVDSSGDLSFKIPSNWKDPGSVDFLPKFQTAAMLWQTATAESFHNSSDSSRRTFTLEFDSNSNVVVWIQKGQLTSSEYSALSKEERFKRIYQEVTTSKISSPFVRYFILVSFAESDNSGNNSSKIALGGGGVGMLDATTLFAWPDSISKASEYFSDPTPIPSINLRDSAYRNANWALSASTLGAGLHELGHALGLDHTDDPWDYMSRGFDRFNRVFMVSEPLSNAGSYIFPEKEVSKWNNANLERLIRSPWIDK